jgi:CRISPR-associated endonuclease/helicase Cas3
MGPANRLDILNKIRAMLDANEPVICISTHLIEAGVNIDFGAVIRSLAGLDSIVQSSGRCNRHGLRNGLGSVWVLNPVEENLDQLIDIKIGREKAQTVLDDYNDNPDSFERDRIGLQAIAAYYNLYYGQRKNDLDYRVGVNTPIGRDDDLYNLLSVNTLSLKAYERRVQGSYMLAFRQSFQSAARTFEAIDSASIGVIVPYKDGEALINELCSTTELKKQTKLLKSAQRYSVGLFMNEFDSMIRKGAVYEVQENTGVYCLLKENYSADTGWSDTPVKAFNDSDIR